MDRAALLEAVWRIAGATAAGSDDREAQRWLDGRRIEVRIRFGCAGPERDLKSAALGWSFDDADRTLRLRAAPTLTGSSPEIRHFVGDAVEAVQGFWIARPWLLDPVCPKSSAIEPAGEARSKDDDAATATPRPSGSVGIAEFFTETDARTGRRQDRAYESVKVLDEDQPISSQGFNLVLSGRLRALPGKKVINCIIVDRDSRPDCVASADLDRVWIEQPGTGEIVAEWGRT